MLRREPFNGLSGEQIAVSVIHNPGCLQRKLGMPFLGGAQEGTAPFSLISSSAQQAPYLWPDMALQGHISQHRADGIAFQDTPNGFMAAVIDAQMLDIRS